MILLSQLEQDLKSALKQGNKEEALTLRMLKAGIVNEQIAQKKDKNEKAQDDLVLAVLKREVKKRKEAIVSFEQAGRNELASKEKAELDILSKYLPAQLSVEQITETVDQVLADLSPGEKNIGLVMKQVLAKIGSQADGKIVSDIVKKKLA